MTAAKGSLLEAMLAVQAESPTIAKNATNPHFRSKYAPLDTIVETVGPILAKHGLVWTTLPTVNNTLMYRLTHAPTGEALEGEMPLLLAKNDAQGFGSAITYARRYAMVAVLNLVADDDDDGNAASAGAAAAPAQTSGGAAYGQRSGASEKQLDYLKGLLRKHKVTAGEARALLTGAGVEVADGEDVHDAIMRLSSAQASNIIDFVSKQPIPTGESDVPGDAGEFTHPPAGGQQEFTDGEAT